MAAEASSCESWGYLEMPRGSDLSFVPYIGKHLGVSVCKWMLEGVYLRTSATTRVRVSPGESVSVCVGMHRCVCVRMGLQVGVCVSMSVNLYACVCVGEQLALCV